MLSELAPQSEDGDYVRPAPQLGSGAVWPARLPGAPVASVMSTPARSGASRQPQ